MREEQSGRQDSILRLNGLNPCALAKSYATGKTIASAGAAASRTCLATVLTDLMSAVSSFLSLAASVCLPPTVLRIWSGVDASTHVLRHSLHFSSISPAQRCISLSMTSFSASVSVFFPAVALAYSCMVQRMRVYEDSPPSPYLV